MQALVLLALFAAVAVAQNSVAPLRYILEGQQVLPNSAWTVDIDNEQQGGSHEHNAIGLYSSMSIRKGAVARPSTTKQTWIDIRPQNNFGDRILCSFAGDGTMQSVATDVDNVLISYDLDKRTCKLSPGSRFDVDGEEPEPTHGDRPMHNGGQPNQPEPQHGGKPGQHGNKHGPEHGEPEGPQHGQGQNGQRPNRPNRPYRPDGSSDESADGVADERSGIFDDFEFSNEDNLPEPDRSHFRPQWNGHGKWNGKQDKNGKHGHGDHSNDELFLVLIIVAIAVPWLLLAVAAVAGAFVACRMYKHYKKAMKVLKPSLVDMKDNKDVDMSFLVPKTEPFELSNAV